MRLWAFYRWCADGDIAELTTLAETIQTWWPAIEVFLTTGLTNARTEGTNRLIKQVKRAAFNRPWGLGQVPVLEVGVFSVGRGGAAGW